MSPEPVTTPHREARQALDTLADALAAMELPEHVRRARGSIWANPTTVGEVPEVERALDDLRRMVDAHERLQ